MQQLMSLSIWFRHAKKHHPEFIRTKTRTDLCAFCHKYDKVFLPDLRRTIQRSMGRLAALEPRYFAPFSAKWEELSQQGKTDPDGAASLQYVKALAAYIDRSHERRQGQRVPDEAGAMAHRMSLHIEEAAARHDLEEALLVLRACEHHFSSVRRQHASRDGTSSTCQPTQWSSSWTSWKT
jgi:hypothetical protein